MTKPTTAAPEPSGEEKGLLDLFGPLLVCILSGDDGGVDSAFESALARGADVASISRSLIEPALSEVGEMWLRGEVTEAEEHLATQAVLRALSRIPTPAPPLDAPQIVFTCPAGEFHELGARVASDIARACGWGARNLGANVPRDALLRFLEERRPQAVGISTALTGHVAECLALADEIRRVLPEAKILLGGQAFLRDPDLGAVCEGVDVCCADAVALREWLVANHPAGRNPGSAVASASRPPSALPESLRRRLT